MIRPLRTLAVATLAFASVAASAGDVRVMSSVGMRGVLDQLQPEFERATAHKLLITFGTAAPLKRQIDEGAAFDVAVLTPPLVADLARSGKVDARSVTSIAKSGVGLAGRKDAARPRRSGGRCSRPGQWRIQKRARVAWPPSR
jgi:molybdate transport system substrate-binding protein